MRTREKEYHRRIHHYDGLRSKVQARYDRISTQRTIAFLSMVGALILGAYIEPKAIFYALAAPLFIAFMVGVFRHRRLKKTIDNLDLLLKINHEGLDRMQDRWGEFTVTGEEYLDEHLSHLSDLNILGKNSLFQMIQLCSTTSGAKRLAGWLSRCEDFTAIPTRQEAINELSMRTALRQHLLMEGRRINDRMDPTSFLEWVKSPSLLIDRPGLIFLQRILVITTIGLMFLSGLGDYPAFWTLGIFFQTLLFVRWGNRCREAYIPALNQDAEFLAYGKMFELLEIQDFKSPSLKDLHSKLFIRHQGVSIQMRRLEKINSALCLHYSILHPFVNVILLWDIHYLYKLEKWKRAVAVSIDEWFDVLGQMEALSSLAGFYFDNPDYVFPQIDEKHPPLSVQEMGHPLIPAKERIPNSFDVQEGGQLTLITGSNMSGKSTFVRTVGINMAIAFAGSAVVAKHFVTKPCRILTCIQVVDSIQQHISHFYAEVKGIKKILDAVKEYEVEGESMPVLYLIDEIFSGTNTKERLLASRGILKMLAASRSYGLVTTHDLELVTLAKESEGIKNYHFEDSIDQSGEMVFYYRLQKGPVSSTNAIKILEREGIQIQENPEADQ